MSGVIRKMKFIPGNMLLQNCGLEIIRQVTRLKNWQNRQKVWKELESFVRMWITLERLLFMDCRDQTEMTNM